MRLILAVSLLVTLCVSANAATVHHARQRHVNVRANQSVTLGSVPGWAYAPGPAVRSQPAPEIDNQLPDVYNRYPNWGG